MAQFKLEKMPDRRQIKYSIAVGLDLHQKLEDYASAYKAAYGADEKLTDLIPFILSQFFGSTRKIRGKSRRAQA